MPIDGVTRAVSGTAAEAPIDLLVLGLGNPLCGDDGLGPRLVSRLSRGYRPDAQTSIVDGGTLGMALLAHLGRTRQAILVDAVDVGAPPGTAVRIEGDEIESVARHRLSVHQVGVADVLESARLIDCLPERLVLHGLVPATTTLGLGCSPAVAAAIPALLDRVISEAAALGHPLHPEEDHARGNAGDGGSPVDALAGDV